MARETKGNRKRKKDDSKPGSDPAAAREVGGKGDFGAPVNRTADRDYVSRNTKVSDRGSAQPASREFEGVRTAGAGGKASGEGSSSGGDLDTDIIGLGTGGGVAASGVVGRPPGPDDSDGTSNEFASGRPAKGENQSSVGRVGGPKRVRGSVVQPTDEKTASSGQGADAATNPADRDDDASAGEVSSGEVQGDNRSIKPSSDEQG